MSFLGDSLTQQLSDRREDGLLRKLIIPENLIDFSSNDYLGLARSSELFNQIREKSDSLASKLNGSTGSRLLTGNSAYIESVETKLAKTFKGQSALIFNSGYNANLSVLSSIPKRNDTIFYDELSHASIKDGCRLSLAKRYPFRHNDPDDLRKKIRAVKNGKIFVVVESIYSMDGDECPLADLITLTSEKNISIILDEAHSTGVMGENGSGMACRMGLQESIDVRIYTFGKALGVHGACVIGAESLKQYLLNFARPFIYTTALSPHSIASIDCALEYLSSNIHLQSQLKSNIDQFLGQVRFNNKISSTSAIQTAIFPGNEKVKQAAQILKQKGFDVRPIVSPTVPKNYERLRICLHTYNTKEEIGKLTEVLNDLESAKL